MRGIILTDEQWSILKNKLLEAGVYRTKKLRLTVYGILFKLKSGRATQMLTYLSLAGIRLTQLQLFKIYNVYHGITEILIWMTAVQVR